MKIKLFFACVVLTIACTVKFPASNSNTNTATQTPAAKEAEQSKPKDSPQKPETAEKKDADSCPAVKRDGMIQIKSQTFPFNFKPFNDMCFVTFGNLDQMLDERDVPRGSTFHLYQNGQSVLDLPDAFDGQEACWVEGVSFKDLNSDGFTDIIIAGSCLAARDSYPANAIFVNTGEDFTTDAAANEKLADFKKLSEIEAFVRKNQSIFF